MTSKCLYLPSITVLGAKLRRTDTHVAAEEAAHEEEVREIVLVANLLHRLFGILEGRLQLQQQHFVNNLFWSAPVILAADASEVLRGDMELTGIESNVVMDLAVLIEQYHKAIVMAHRVSRFDLPPWLLVAGTLVAYAQQKAAKYAHALLILTLRVFICQNRFEEGVYGVECRRNPLLLLGKEGARRHRGIAALDDNTAPVVAVSPNDPATQEHIRQAMTRLGITDLPDFDAYVEEYDW